MKSFISNEEVSNTDNVIRLELELTSVCNLECPLCLRTLHSELKSKVKYRSKEEILSSIEQYKNLKYITIAGPISEPSTHPEFFHILGVLIKRGFDISLFINGDTHNDVYYKRLGLLIRGQKVKVYFTICGSTQELHQKYRVGSNLENVLRRYNIVQKLSRETVLTYIVFEYNQKDFLDHKEEFEKKYNLESFYTLPVQEHFNIKELSKNGIHLPKEEHLLYLNKIDKNDKEDIICPAKEYQFRVLDHQGKPWYCSLQRLFGESHCFECSKRNAEVLRNNNIYHLAEPENDTSELGLRL